MTRKSIVSQLTEAGILGKNLKVTKSAERRLTPDLLQKLIHTTMYLDESASTYERLLNLRLGITKEPLCENCGTGLTGRIYWSKRCYHRFCNEACRHSFVTAKRTATLTANGSALAKSISKKSVSTQRSRGTLESRIKKSLATKRKNGQCIPEHLVPAFQAYRSKVHSITNKQPLHLLENIEKRGAIELGGWHVDHEYSIHQGFLDGTPPETTGHYCNLRVIPGSLNVSKQDKCSITLKQLLLRIENHQS